MDEAAKPDVEALIAELRARVEERRRSGFYPPGFEEDLEAISNAILAQRGRRLPDPTGAIAAVTAAIFDATRIPVSSSRPAGAFVHQAVARLVARQVHGVLEQMREFAEVVRAALEELAETLTALHTEVTDRLDAVYERQAAQERAIVQGSAWPGAARVRIPLPGWWSAVDLEEHGWGSRAEVLERYRDVAARLAGHGPVIDLACGRGELLELLGGMGVEARGWDSEPDLVALAVEHGLAAEPDEAVPGLARVGDAALGGLVMLRRMERLSPAELVQLVDLAGRKVRPGGLVILGGINPAVPGAWTHPALCDPALSGLVPPVRLRFLLHQAGFVAVDVEEWGEMYLAVATR